MDSTAFFEDWSLLARSSILALVGYLALVALIRIARKRTLSKMNVFDFVFAEGLAALGSLILVQVVLSWVITKSDTLERLINGDPVLLFVRGRFLRDTMKRERVTEEEIKSAVREQGLESLEDVEALVLETDGSFSVVERRNRNPSALSDVAGYGEAAQR
jgi:uncharacterized membrane protein YcaP (DUF421 family)